MLHFRDTNPILYHLQANCTAIQMPFRTAAQKRGALAIAQPKGAPPLPPFERWSFAEMRYVQWLVDMHAVHYTLEAAVADATTVAATEHYSSASPSHKPLKTLKLHPCAVQPLQVVQMQVHLQ